MVKKATEITEKWRARLAGESPNRRFLLVGSDIILILTAVMVIGILASMLIRYGDGAALGEVAEKSLSSTGVAHVTHFPERNRSPVDTAMGHASKHLHSGYRCQRHPEVISSSPGHCPVCGEELRLQTAAEETTGKVVSLSVVVLKDTERLQRVPLFGDSWVDKVMVKPGEQVEKGALIMTLYAPEFGDGVARESGKVNLYAPVAGTVRAIYVKEGGFVTSGTVAVDIEESNKLWLMGWLNPENAAQVQAGQRVDVVTMTQPGERLHGEVGEVDINYAGDATVWLRIGDNPHLRVLPQVDAHIYL